jgi:hypothetical protein
VLAVRCWGKRQSERDECVSERSNFESCHETHASIHDGGDATYHQWVNAVLGNDYSNGGNSFFVSDTVYDPLNPALFSLGNYGVDTTHHLIWAVLNHNSEFTILNPTPYNFSSNSAVPEPGMVGLWLVGGLVLWRYGRNGKRSAIGTQLSADIEEPKAAG